MALFPLVIGMLGLVIGSFLNVVIHRLPRRESLAFPGSKCPSCGAPVRPWDNVPVVSWLILRGRCRKCRAGISPRYPLVELLTGVVFAAVVLARGVGPHLLLDLPLATVLIAVAGIDLEHHIVPDRIVVPTAVFGLLVAALVFFSHLPELLIAGAAAFLFFLLAALLYPAGMGMGDVKLAGVMGLYLGLSVIPALFVAFVLGTVVGLIMMARHGASARKSGVPFAPFMATGGLVALVVGPQLIDLYVSTFLY